MRDSVREVRHTFYSDGTIDILTTHEAEVTDDSISFFSKTRIGFGVSIRSSLWYARQEQSVWHDELCGTGREESTAEPSREEFETGCGISFRLYR